MPVELFCLIVKETLHQTFVPQKVYQSEISFIKLNQYLSASSLVFLFRPNFHINSCYSIVVFVK